MATACGPTISLQVQTVLPVVMFILDICEETFVETIIEFLPAVQIEEPFELLPETEDREYVWLLFLRENRQLVACWWCLELQSG